MSILAAPMVTCMRWRLDDDGGLAQPVFRYPLMTGENHVSYHRGLGRYIMGNYGFLDEGGKPRPYHATGCWPQSCLRGQR